MRALTEMRPPLGVNLTAFDSRFHSTCCRRVASASTLASRTCQAVCIDSFFASAAGRMLSSAASSTGTSGSASSSTCSLPVVIRDMSTRSFTSCACAWALRSISSSACWRAPFAEMVVEQHARPPENDVQRRAQLVRQGRQELVFQAVGLAQPAFGAFVRQVGDHDRDRPHVVDVERDGRQLRRVQRAGRGPQLDLHAIDSGCQQRAAPSAGRRCRRTR